MNLLSGASICIGFLLYFLNSLGPGAECFCWGLDFDVGFRSSLLGSKSSLLRLCTVFLKRGLRPLYFLNRFGPGAKCSCWGLDLYVGFRSSLLGSKSSQLGLCTVFLKRGLRPFIS